MRANQTLQRIPCAIAGRTMICTVALLSIARVVEAQPDPGAEQ
jgi:hypothetical protein